MRFLGIHTLEAEDDEKPSKDLEKEKPQNVGPPCSEKTKKTVDKGRGLRYNINRIVMRGLL